MKLINSTILAIVIAGGFSMTAYVMGGDAPVTTGPTGAGQSLQGVQPGAAGQIGQPIQGSNMSKPMMSASPGGSVTPSEPKASGISKPAMSASPGGSVTPSEPKASGISKPTMSASPGGSVTPSGP